MATLELRITNNTGIYRPVVKSVLCILKEKQQWEDNIKTMKTKVINNKILLSPTRSNSLLELETNNISSQSKDLKSSKSKSFFHHHAYHLYSKFLFHLIFSLQILLSFILHSSEGKVLELSDRYISLYVYLNSKKGWNIYLVFVVECNLLNSSFEFQIRSFTTWRNVASQSK